MALTPETLTRHELIGLYIAVADAANPDLIGISGRVVDETMQTLHIESISTVAMESPSPPAHHCVSTQEPVHMHTHSQPQGQEQCDTQIKQVPKRDSVFEFCLESAIEIDSVSTLTHSHGQNPTSDKAESVSGSAQHSSTTHESNMNITDEAAGVVKTSGTTSNHRLDTTGEARHNSDLPACQSNRPISGSTAQNAEMCEDAAYVTVDGTRLLSRPALRTEKAGDSLWR
ncbi:ribonuclease P protein component 1 [Haloquadratum walsbyi C23]|uniref:Ribonuclease P protein component 1 n=1 Tax=Haloquadratum walsbyi (strain DSM 16854 / JCM 12705 / C23) TaxID=768065 RepID=G0LJR9_HALWC|nr:ribonuclease P protein subunit [Haloquadratum walsbyi]CCC41003.1 ribonuclease P protein component 1 [Haloquadratum walsbyi C23]